MCESNSLEVTQTKEGISCRCVGKTNITLFRSFTFYPETIDFLKQQP